MADELTITASVTYEDSDGVEEIVRSLTGLGVTVTTKRFVHVKNSIGVTEEAMTLGEVSTLGYCWIKNLDETNFVEVRVSTGSTKMVKVKAGEASLFRFGSGVTAPYIIADTAACLVEYILWND